jgi:carboxyvinyl-carboxyphosphonate phosphorylmutase
MSIIARTNAGQLTTEETIARVKAYQAVGVDGICMVGIRDFAHLEEITQHITIPVMLVAYDNPELRDRERLAANGVRIVVNGHAAYFAAIKATYDCLREQRGIAEGKLNASELSTRYSTLEENRVWANKYMDVQE